MNLYEISTDIEALSAIIDQCEAEGVDVDESIYNAFESLQGDLESKIGGYCKYLANIKAQADARKAEAKRLAEMARADSAKYDRIKGFLKTVISSRLDGKFSNDTHSLKVAKSGGKQALIIDSDKELPTWAIEMVPVTNKEAIRLALDEGQELDFAHLAERSTTLRGV